MDSDNNQSGRTIEGTATRDASIAVALHYDGDAAPTVTAKGKGDVARQILEIAQQHDVPLHEDADLVQLLSRLDLGDEIPRNLYIAVAEVIAFAYLVSGKYKDMMPEPKKAD